MKWRSSKNTATSGEGQLQKRSTSAFTNSTESRLAEIRESGKDKSLMLQIVKGDNERYKTEMERALAVQYIKTPRLLIKLFKNGVPPMVQENIVYYLTDIEALKSIEQFAKTARVACKLKERISSQEEKRALLIGLFFAQK